jgi:hypothetical protein
MLEAAIRDEPSPDEFEGWLMERCAAEGLADGALRAMALFIWDQWQLASRAPDMQAWIAAGGQSDDRDPRTTTPKSP